MLSTKNRKKTKKNKGLGGWVGGASGWSGTSGETGEREAQGGGTTRWVHLKDPTDWAENGKFTKRLPRGMGPQKCENGWREMGGERDPTLTGRGGTYPQPCTWGLGPRPLKSVMGLFKALPWPPVIHFDGGRCRDCCDCCSCCVHFARKNNGGVKPKKQY